MPTATVPIHIRAAMRGSDAAVTALQDHMHAMLAELNRQLEVALLVELAKLEPAERRLFRAELAPIQTAMDETSYNVATMVATCDPPRVWLVERGSDDDNLTDEQATALIKAGAGACRFSSDGDCTVALCDYCHPEAWL